MVNKLKSYGVIRSECTERGFQNVDRKFFVPRGNESLAHSDQPLKEGNVHISAPHIYGSALEALDLVPDSSTSFLNVGSGTGYISCVVAHILGPNSLNYGVELHSDVVEHCLKCVSKWRPNTVQEKDGVSTIHFNDDTPDIQIIKGNGLNIQKDRGECVAGFDRIYIGASIDKDELSSLTEMLSPGGILVGPVEDELVKVMRVGIVGLETEGDQSVGSSSGLSQEYTSQILSGVRFAPLIPSPIKTIIPSQEWSPSLQTGYPSEYKQATMQLMLCSSSELVQPPPKILSREERFNAAAMLPKSIWFHILSYTHRKWFEPDLDENEYLKRRLQEEKAKVANAQRKQREAEERCRAADRERVVYRLLARRWQSRLNMVLSQNDNQVAHAQDQAAEELTYLLDNAGSVSNITSLAALRGLLQELSGQYDSDDDDDEEAIGEETSDAEEEHGTMEDDEMEEAHQDFSSNLEEDLLELFEGDEASESDGDLSEDESVEMEDVEALKNLRSSDQPRSVSISSDDL